MTAPTGEMARPSAPPRVDPRMRQRWVAARRAEGRRRLRWAAALGSVAALVVAGVVLLRSPLTAIRHLRVVGARHETAARIEAVAGVQGGDQLLGVDPATAAARLERLPWIGTAVVVRDWPDAVTITVTERSPVAQVPAALDAAGKGKTVLVDASGRVLTSPAAPSAALPILVGVGAGGPAGVWLGGAQAPAALAVAAMVPPSLARYVRQLSVAGGTIMASVVAPGVAPGGPGVSVNLGGPTSLGAKITALETLVDQVNLSRVTGIDLRIPDRPVLTGSPQPGNVSSTAGG